MVGVLRYRYHPADFDSTINFNWVGGPILALELDIMERNVVYDIIGNTSQLYDVELHEGKTKLSGAFGPLETIILCP
jgi:hypothetical protein